MAGGEEGAREGGGDFQLTVDYLADSDEGMPEVGAGGFEQFGELELHGCRKPIMP